MATEQMDLEMKFNTMLNEVYTQIDEKLGQATKLVIPTPIIEKSTTNTYWKNVKKILITINRPPEHFIEYLNKQLNTGEWLSQSKSDGIVLIGKYNITQLTEVVRNYVNDYVICNICKSTNTELERNKDLRLYMVSCKKCNSKYSV
jgi:translation initiation factor 2 subunit 2